MALIRSYEAAKSWNTLVIIFRSLFLISNIRELKEISSHATRKIPG